MTQEAQDALLLVARTFLDAREDGDNRDDEIERMARRALRLVAEGE